MVLAVRGWKAEAESLDEDGPGAAEYAGVRRHEPRAQAARLHFRRLDDLLRVHAGDGDGERPPDDVLPVPPRVARPLASEASEPSVRPELVEGRTPRVFVAAQPPHRGRR